jgi:hypothetical protein
MVPDLLMGFSTNGGKPKTCQLLLLTGIKPTAGAVTVPGGGSVLPVNLSYDGWVFHLSSWEMDFLDWSSAVVFLLG